MDQFETFNEQYIAYGVYPQTLVLFLPDLLFFLISFEDWKVEFILVESSGRWGETLSEEYRKDFPVTCGNGIQLQALMNAGSTGDIR